MPKKRVCTFYYRRRKLLINFFDYQFLRKSLLCQLLYYSCICWFNLFCFGRLLVYLKHGNGIR